MQRVRASSCPSWVYVCRTRVLFLRGCIRRHVRIDQVDWRYKRTSDQHRIGIGELCRFWRLVNRDWKKKKGKKKKKKDQLGCVYKSLWDFWDGYRCVCMCVFLLTLLPLLEDTNNVVGLLLLFLSLSSLLCELGWDGLSVLLIVEKGRRLSKLFWFAYIMLELIRTWDSYHWRKGVASTWMIAPFTRVLVRTSSLFEALYTYKYHRVIK